MAAAVGESLPLCGRPGIKFLIVCWLPVQPGPCGHLGNGPADKSIASTTVSLSFRLETVIIIIF